MKLIKRFTFAVVTVLIVVSLAGMKAFAVSTTQEGITITLSTDRSAYEKNESIPVIFSVRNDRPSSITNVSMQVAVPDGYRLAENCVNTKTVSVMAPETSEELSIVLAPVSVPEESSGESSNQRNSTAEDEQKETSSGLFSDDEPSADMVSVNSSKESQNIYGILAVIGGIILAVLVVTILLIVCFRKKKGRKMLSLFLTISVIGGTLALSDIKTNAVDEEKTITINDSVMIEGRAVELKGTVSLCILPDEDNIDLSIDFDADEHYFLCGTESDVTFTANVSGAPDHVELMRNGNELVGYMHDDGKNGDETAGDGKYTYRLTDTVDSEETVNTEYFLQIGEKRSAAATLHYISDNDVKTSNETTQEIIADITSMEAEFYQAKTDEEKAEAAVSVFNDMLDYTERLEQEGKIISYSVYKNTIRMRLPALTYVYTFEPEEEGFQEKPAVGGQNHPTVSGNAFTAYDSDENYIVSLQPFASTLKNAVFDEAANGISKLDSYSFVPSDNLDDTAVSIEKMSHLNPYKVIILDGHGGYDNEDHSFIVLPEKYTAASKEMYPLELCGDHPEIIVTNQDYLAVTSRFFEEKYKDNPLNDCIIYLGCCHSAENDVLANTLRSCGAKTVFGFKNTVLEPYNHNLVTTIFSVMTEQDEKEGNVSKTAKDAYDYALKKHGKTDQTGRHWYNKLYYMLFSEPDEHIKEILQSDPAELRLIGDWDFRLKDYVTFEGNITDEEGYALDGVTVMEEHTFLLPRTCNGSYSFRIGSLNEKNYTLIFRKKGYKEKKVSLINNKDQYNDVTLEKASQIPKDAFVYHGHSYYIYSDVSTWEEALAYCRSLGGYLAVINNAGENDALFNYMKSCGYESAYFGYTDAGSEGRWRWVPEDSSSYVNWSKTEPNNDLSCENYAMFYYNFVDGSWNDGEFNGRTVRDTTAFICEWNALPTTDSE